MLFAATNKKVQLFWKTCLLVWKLQKMDKSDCFFSYTVKLQTNSQLHFFRFLENIMIIIRNDNNKQSRSIFFKFW